MEEVEIIKPDIEAIDMAYMCHTEIQQRTRETARNLLELGRLFKRVRDEKLYALMDCATFEEYLAMPEISFGRSTVFSFIKIYERYIVALEISPDLLTDIGHRKLQIINPVVEKDKNEWLYKAKELSDSDLINEVRLAQGKVPMKPKKKDEPEVYPFSFDNYIAFVESHPCIICDKESEKAHFPKTKGAGAPDEWIIPLCRACHSEYHNDPYEFVWIYKDKIFGYFYDTFLKAYKIFYEFGGE